MSIHNPEFWSFVYTVLNALLCVGGFILTVIIKRLYKTIDDLVAADENLRDIMQAHREDVLRNYPMNAQLQQVKMELLGRFDRLEDTLLKKG